MAYGGTTSSGLRLCSLALAAVLLAAGCSEDPDEDTGRASTDRSPQAENGGGGPGDAEDTPGHTVELDLSRAPRNKRQALKLARIVTAQPASWGAGFVRGSSYESGPDTVAVLDENCVWQRRALRKSELASLTRRSVLPAENRKGRLRVSAVVTVYRDVESAKWAMARTLEDALRCPDQQLNAQDRVIGLRSTGIPFRDRHGPQTDLVYEHGEVRTGKGEAYPYSWSQSRRGALVVSAAVKGAEGHDEERVEEAAAKGEFYMRQQIEFVLGVPE